MPLGGAISLIMAVKRRGTALPFIAAERPVRRAKRAGRCLPVTRLRDRRTVSTTLNVGELLNLVGLSTGVVLYAMLLAMVVRAGRTPGLTSGFDPLLLLTSLLGLVWNLCALPPTSCRRWASKDRSRLSRPSGSARSASCPAVVVHSVLADERHAVRGGETASLAAVAYAVSAHGRRACTSSAAWTAAPVPSSLGMRLLTYTFVALVVPLAAVTRGQPGRRRALWAAALATFAVSALHLSQLHRGDASWPVELVGHHASLPLAFAILYQDYPLRAGGSVPEARAGAARDRRGRLRGHRDVRRSIGGVRAIRAGRSAGR